MNEKYYKIVTLLIFLSLAITSCIDFYSEPSETKRESENYKDGEFVNTEPSEGVTESFIKVGYKFMFENWKSRKPNFDIPIVKVDIDSFASKSSDELSVIWLGHATTLINIEGSVILTDPMLTKWASPIAWFGPKRFFDSPIAIENLPILDAVLISHNHYDHLDKESVLSLNGITNKFVVPTGVASTLIDWGILPKKIIEKGWDEKFKLNEKVEIITTPTHHFSGRGPFDRNKTLWASFVIKSKHHSIYFGGDSGFFTGYKEIGRKYGPFEMTLLPIGAYSKMWQSIHMDPREAVQAHLDLKGKLLFPIHWGTFDLALHSWNEPPELLISESQKSKVSIVLPKPGEIVKSNCDKKIEKWWIQKIASK